MAIDHWRVRVQLESFLILFLAILSMLVATAVGLYEGVDPNTLSCDPLGQVSLHLPHFTDCSKFYMCAHGKEVEFSCSGGLYFDFNIQTCNWPYNTKCHLRGQNNYAGRSGGRAFDWPSTSNSYPGSSSISMDALIKNLKSHQSTSGQGNTYNTNLNMYLINMGFDIRM